jgi:hypothetical protein
MAKADIVVTWDGTNFTFVPQNYKVRQPGQFTIGQASGSTWTFTGTTGLPNPPFQVTVRPTLITVEDQVDGQHNYPYGVTIKDSKGNPHDSGKGKGDTTPPIIMNE